MDRGAMVETIRSVVENDRARDAASIRGRWVDAAGKTLRRSRLFPLHDFSPDIGADWACDIGADLPPGSSIRWTLLDGTGTPLAGCDRSYRPSKVIIDVHPTPSPAAALPFEPPATVPASPNPVISTDCVSLSAYMDVVRQANSLTTNVIADKNGTIQALMEQNRALCAALVNLAGSNQSVVTRCLGILETGHTSMAQRAQSATDAANARWVEAHNLYTKASLIKLHSELSGAKDDTEDDEPSPWLELAKQGKDILPDLIAVLKGAPSPNALAALVKSAANGDDSTFAILRRALGSLTSDERQALSVKLLSALAED